MDRTGDTRAVADSSALPFRVLRRSLRAASRAGASMVERVLRREELEPFSLEREAGRAVRPLTAPVVVHFGTVASPVQRGSTVLEAATTAGVDLRSYCGGNCSCGTCRVEVVSGARHLSPMEPSERFVLGPEAEARGDRLACQAQVLGDVSVAVPDWF